MNARERFLATVRFEPVDRPFRWETLGMWPETLERWYAQGLDPDDAHTPDYSPMAPDGSVRQPLLVHEFGFDRVDYLGGRVVSGYTDSPFCPPFERRILEEHGDTRVVQDVNGIVQREFTVHGTSSMPQFLRYPVETRTDFRQLLPRLDPDHPDRLVAGWQEWCAFYRQRDFPIGLTLCGAFGHPRNLLGVERLCTSYYDQPALIHEIMEQWTGFYCRLASRVWQDLPFDFILIWEDMAYRNGPLISPRLVREFMLPYYRRVIDHVRRLGCEAIIVDSDGDVRLLVPLFLEAGANAMLPFEVQAGMDVRAFRQQYGRSLAILGGIDKRVLAQGRAAIDRELEERVPPLIAGGGYFPSLDHTVPPDVPLEAFRYYLGRVREIGARGA